MPEAADIARVLYSDLHGLSHGKYVAADELDHPTHYAVTVITQAIDGDMPPAPGYGADVGFPDMEARVDLATRRPGWEPDTDVVFADLYHTDGRELPIDVRRRAAPGLRAVDGAGAHTDGRLRDGAVPAGQGPVRGPGGVERAVAPRLRHGDGVRSLRASTRDLRDLPPLRHPGRGRERRVPPGQMEVALHYRDAESASDGRAAVP